MDILKDMKNLKIHLLITFKHSNHSCPEAKTQFTELFNGSVNIFLVHFGHILWNCKSWNVNMGVGPLFWFGLDSKGLTVYVDLIIWAPLDLIPALS